MILGKYVICITAMPRRFPYGISATRRRPRWGNLFLARSFIWLRAFFFRNLHAVRPSTTRGGAARGNQMPVREPIGNICCWMVPDRDRFAIKAMHHLAVKVVTPTVTRQSW
jgi:hypothetical protein